MLTLTVASCWGGRTRRALNALEPEIGMQLFAAVVRQNSSSAPSTAIQVLLKKLFFSEENK